MKRNWRGYAARTQWYFEQGSISLQQFKQALYAAAAIKILLELSVLTAILITPLVFIALLAWGVFWIRYGWFKHLQEIPSIDAVVPINMWGLWMQVRMFKKLGLDLDGMDLSKFPPEIQHIFASRKD